MHNTFVLTSNVERYLEAVETVEARGAPEACFMLSGGPAGYGKSRTSMWWALSRGAIFIRLKAACTPHWFLTDLVRELGLPPSHTCEKLFDQAIIALVHHQRPLVIDECEHATRHDATVLDTVRDIADLTEVPVVLVGREFVKARLKRHPQLWTRISAVADFGPATIDDVALCCANLSEVAIADDLVEEIHRQSEGYIRSVVNAIRVVERKAKRGAGTVKAEDLAGVSLVQAWQARRPTVGVAA